MLIVKRVLLALFLTNLATSQSSGGTVSAHQYNGHVYLIVNTPLTWNEARDDAAKALGHLAIISSEAENQFIYTNLLARGISTTAQDGGGARYAWIGGSDTITEGSWLWVDGTQLSTGYTKWGHGSSGHSEPDNYNGTQDNLAMGLEGWPIQAPGYYGYASEWNDVNGDNQLAYIIEFDSATKDSDNDGVPDWKEYIANTSPTNTASVLKLEIQKRGKK